MEDLGLFGPGSMAWRIHGDPSSLIGGLRALLLQALNPLAMAVMAQSSNFARTHGAGSSAPATTS